jgi:oligogalacturonide lyase
MPIGFMFCAMALAADEPPTDWIDPATGHRVVRLSREPDTSSFYFHQNAYTGDKLVVQTPSGLSTIDLKTHEIVPIVEGRVGQVVVGNKSGNVYYSRMGTGAIYSTNVNTKETKEIGKAPGRGGSGLAVNADETLLGGSMAEGGAGAGRFGPGGDGAKGDSKGDAKGDEKGTPGADASLPRPEDTRGAQDASQQNVRRFAGRERGLAQRLAAKIPMKLYTVNIATGETSTFNPSTDWQNHVQMSPSDPTLMMFCHEGPWHDVDRIWTIHTDGSGLKLMHPRTMKYEIAGHEFFGFDGKTIWYDLQTPRSDKFWLAGVNVDTGERIRYPIERSQWSVHYNQSHDGKLFAGDGGGPGSVANRTPLPDNKPLDPPGNGMWMYLFRPVDHHETMTVGDETVKIGKFEAEKLVDLSKHNYELEPNLTFTPDNKWLIFRSNMHGPTHVYAVEIAKAEPAAGK